MIKLVDAFKISKGKKAQESDLVTNLRYIQIGDLRNDDEIKYAIGDSTNVLCSKDDILIAWDGANAGTVGYNLEGVIGSTLAKLTPKTEKINTQFAGRLLQSKFNYLRENCTGATIPHISRHSLENIQIPLPPLPAQQKIAAILDAADELRQKDKALVTKYDELTQALFLDMFGDTWKNPKGWELKNVEDVAANEKNSIKAGPFGSSLKKEFYVEKGYKIYGQEQVIKDNLDFGNYYINEKKYKELESCKIKEGDILISLVGTYGKISVVPEKYEEGIINPRLMKISPNTKIIRPHFLKILLQSDGAMMQLKNFSRGGTMDIINVGIVRKITIPLPPIKLQNQFAERVKVVEEQKSIAQASLLKSEELFNSLLQKAFNGELV